MYLLDTNHISFILVQKDQNVINRLESLPSGVELTINATVYSELIYMVEKSARKDHNRALLDQLIQDLNLRIYPLNKKTAEVYGQLHAIIFAYYAPEEPRQRRGYRIDRAGVRSQDLWIAATAMQHELTIVSEDSDFATINQALNPASKLNLECWKTPTTSRV